MLIANCKPEGTVSIQAKSSSPWSILAFKLIRDKDFSINSALLKFIGENCRLLVITAAPVLERIVKSARLPHHIQTKPDAMIANIKE